MLRGDGRRDRERSATVLETARPDTGVSVTRTRVARVRRIVSV